MADLHIPVRITCQYNQYFQLPPRIYRTRIEYIDFSFNMFGVLAQTSRATSVGRLCGLYDKKSVERVGRKLEQPVDPLPERPVRRFFELRVPCEQAERRLLRP